jgi:hypothetical protein
MAIVYRTSGAWGAGIAEDLDPEQVDNNFWELVQDVAEKAVQGVGISNIVQTASGLVVVLTDHTLMGPFELPVATITFSGEWVSNYSYPINTIITHGGSTYITLIEHTSEATFDPGANNGQGQDFYGLLLENPELSIPGGGATGAFLRKRTGADLDTEWTSAALTDLSDVDVPDSPAPTDGDVLTFLSGLWQPSTPATALSGLSDVSILTSPLPVTGEILTFDGIVWTNTAPGGFSPAIDAPAPGQLLSYDGSFWVNSNTANIPIFSLGGQFGTISIDYALGAVQRVTMIGGTTLDEVTNWPPAGQFGRLLLEITNNGAFTWSWPTTYKWSGGDAPEVSISGRDIYALTTFDGGTIVSGSIIGKNYI